jgi:hypothetical protein
MSVILATREVEIKRIATQVSLCRKVWEIPASNNKKLRAVLGAVLHSSHLSYVININRTISIQADPGINMRP